MKVLHLRRWIVLLIVGLLGALPQVALASTESIQRISAAAISALDIGQGGVATVDPALRVDRCPEALESRVVRDGTVEVVCPALGWRVFVPVRIRNARSVVVLAQAVPAGQVIKGSDLSTENRDVGKIAQGVVVDPAFAVGRVARRHLQAGSLLLANDLHADMVIRRGDTVDLITRRGTVEIRVKAKASRDAVVGDVLTVENLSTRKSVQGTVIEDGTVHVR